MQRDERRKQTIFRHSGYEMRSMSEVRWASIMDVLRVRWLYEPRVVDTRHGWYLPDFYLPACGVYIEVKGPAPVLEEIEKAKDAEEETGCPVIFAHGNPEMLHGELFHGLLTYYGPNGPMDFPTAEMGALVRRFYDIHTYAAFLAAGDRRERPDVVMLGEALEELFQSWMDRQGLEEWKRRIHQPLNEARRQDHQQSSLAEWFVSEFARLVESKRTKEAA